KLTLPLFKEHRGADKASEKVFEGHRSFAISQDEADMAEDADATDNTPFDSFPNIPLTSPFQTPIFMPVSQFDPDDTTREAHNYNSTSRQSPDAELPPPNPSQDPIRTGHDSDDDVIVVTSAHDYDRLAYEETNETSLCILGLAIAVPHTSPKEPTTVRQALSGPDSEKWKAAMATEVSALKRRGTWKLVPRSSAKGRKILSGKWVFRIKTLADGSIDKYKVRWVVRGFEKTHMVDYDQTFTHAGRHTSVRILICIAAVKQRPLRQIDVGSAFLYALVDAIIFVEQPHAFEESDGAVCLLQKSLYGINLNITQCATSIHLFAAKYAETLANKFAIAPINLTTPFRTPHNHEPDTTPLSIEDRRLYQQQLGYLLFAAVTCRLYLSYVASQLAQYLRRPEGENLLDICHALQYFISTPGVGLTYVANLMAILQLHGYVDADHAGDVDNRRSRTGFIFQLQPAGLISWNSLKQELITLSSAEAEFIAASAAVRKGLCLIELMQEAKVMMNGHFTLLCDDQSAIKIVNNPSFVNRTKHIALRCFFVKDEIDKGKVKLT
ncbi:unnamed protein product, partial [Closterium sp. NIES-53]